MIFAQSIDPRWNHRHADSRKAGKGSARLATAAGQCCHDHAHANMARALPFPPGIVTASSHPAGEVVTPEKGSRLGKRKGLLMPLLRVEVVPAALRAVDLKIGRTAGGADILGSAVGRQQVQQQQQHGGGEKGWREELLGYGARVLALSVSSAKRELLCDRKEPFEHLTPKRLAFTVVKSGLLVASPMINEAILASEEEENQPPSRNPSRVVGDLSGLGARNSGMGTGIYIDGDGHLVCVREEKKQEVQEEEERSGEWAHAKKALSESFEHFPAFTCRKILHNVMTVSMQRVLEWQAVMCLSARTADRLTKNIALSALRKTERMSRGRAAAKMTLTAGKALVCQNVALFIVDEIFLAVTLGVRERRRRKQNPYSCTDWPALLREMRKKSIVTAAFAFGIWMAGTLGSVVGTLVYPTYGPDLLSTLAEAGASALLS